MKVRFRKHIHANCSSVSSLDKWLYRDIDLPMEPFKGLEVTDEKDWYETIKEISFSLKTKKIECWTEDDDQLYRSALSGHKSDKTIDDIVKDYIEEGWKLDKEA